MSMTPSTCTCGTRGICTVCAMAGFELERGLLDPMPDNELLESFWISVAWSSAH